MKNFEKNNEKTAYYHLPGLFEFYELYQVFLPLFYEHREYFYEWCEIGSIYGAPGDCLWGGGRVGYGENEAKNVWKLMRDYNISPRLTFSNSLLEEEHFEDLQCNKLCALFEHCGSKQSGIIIYSEELQKYLKEKYPDFYYVSSTTKVILEPKLLLEELNSHEYQYVVPDFRLNKNYELLEKMTANQKDKVEFLCNECCDFNCKDREACYENVSKKVLGIDCEDHVCRGIQSDKGYIFSNAMDNKGFIGIEDINNWYLPNGFSNFKIEGRSLGSAIVLEFLLYYMTKPQYQLRVREKIYLDSSLDLF